MSVMSLSCWILERRAVSSFFFERLTLIRRLPVLCYGEEFEFTRASFSREGSLDLCLGLVTVAPVLNMLASVGS